ncbi:MBOAT2 [Bugula neritina]|uniref:MBOAT2 n=1 Tax=Bugula neritina TaxID=10212 RepID=A0A7J7J1Y9_BUGNE|nr:MBOAT2 [Bugula neritina]
METLTSLPVSTVIILGTHLGTLPVAHWFSRYNSSEKSLWLSKHRVAALLGLATILICYQWSALQLILQWLISYTLLHTVPKHQLGKISFVILYGHVIVVNAFKFIYKYGDISLDYTGSMMLGTMRLTSLAFSIQDSTKPEEKLTELQKQRVMKQDITLEKHFCYCFSFIGILFGPFIFYEDHEKYMNKKSSEFNANNYKATLTLLQGVLALIIVIVALPHYPVEKNFAYKVGSPVSR